MARPSSGQVASLAVALAVGGMGAGAVLVLGTGYQLAGWLVFVLSFAGWLGAALLAMREGWHRGGFDR